MEGSKRTTTRVGHLSSSTKNKQTNKQTNKQKRKNLMIECLLSISTSNCFKFTMTPTSWKSLWPPSQNQTFKQTKDCRQHALVTSVNWDLKVGTLLVIFRVLKVLRLE